MALPLARLYHLSGDRVDRILPAFHNGRSSHLSPRFHGSPAVIYVVLGMHKSGTTLISQILHHSGVNMGGAEIETSRSYDEGNKY